MSRFEEAVLKLLAVVLVPTVLGLAAYVNILWRSSADSSPTINPYVPPEAVYSMIEYVKKSTVLIQCDSNRGSGFAFELYSDAKYDDAIWRFSAPSETETLILTNYHVISECLTSTVSVRLLTGENLDGQVVGTDAENDLAALVIGTQMTALYAANHTFDSGYWVMASGSPLDLSGTVTFGNIINIEENRIYTSASLNRGNSGGPLVDNEGLVLGINTGYRAVAQNINWAVDINALCAKLAICRNPQHGLIHPREWQE
jgi:hypothetical protein